MLFRRYVAPCLPKKALNHPLFFLALLAKPHSRHVDDSHLNCSHAHARGWKTAHKLEPEDPEPAEKAAEYEIRDLEELRDIFPQFFINRNRIPSVDHNDGAHPATAQL